MSEVHLDPVVLAALQEVMEAEYGVLLDTFLADSAGRIERLKQAVQTYDNQALHHIAHSFKGSCGNMGALVLARLCQQLEDAVKANNQAAIISGIECISAEFSIVRRLIEHAR